jgi:hypothetical protein
MRLYGEGWRLSPRVPDRPYRFVIDFGMPVGPCATGPPRRDVLGTGSAAQTTRQARGLVLAVAGLSAIVFTGPRV